MTKFFWKILADKILDFSDCQTKSNNPEQLRTTANNPLQSNNNPTIKK